MGSLPLWSLGPPDQNRATNLLLWSPVWLVAHFAFFELDSHEHWLAAGQAQIPKSLYGILMNNLPLWSPARPGLASQGFTKHPLEQKRRKNVLPDLHQHEDLL